MRIVFAIVFLALLLVACTVVIGTKNTVDTKGDAKVNTKIEPPARSEEMKDVPNPYERKIR